MAESAVIGALRVVLGADTAAFESGLKKAQAQTNSFAASVTKIAAGIGLERGLEKAADAITHAFKEAIKSADEMGKAAQKVGLPVEELSKLKLAADLSDVSMESLSTGLGKLSKAMVEVARGGENLAFRQLDIDVKNADRSLKSAGEVLAEVAGKFEGLKDGASKTAVAMALFGKGGKDLIPLLNEGKTGLEEMMHAAEKMGLVISKDTAAQAQKFNDNIKLLDAAKQGLVNTVMAGVLPAMVRLSDSWVKTAKDGDTMRFAADKIVESIKQLVFGGFAAVELNDLLGKSFIALQEAVTSFPDIDKSRAAIERFQQVWATIEPTLARLRITVNSLFSDLDEEGKKKSDLGFDANVQKAIEDLGFKTRILNNEFKGLAVGFPELAKGLGIFGEAANENRTTVAQLTPQLALLNQAQQAFKAAQITQENLLPWQAYEQQLARLQMMLEAGKISQETFARAAQKAADTAGMSFKAASTAISGSFVEIANSVGGSTSQIAKIAQVGAAAVALINTLSAESFALAGPFPANLVAMALVAAKGAALIGAIKSTTIPSFAAGGSFMVGGGKSMTDNVTVPLNLASGERVDITPANDVGSRRGGGRDVNITLQGERFSRDQVRELMETINGAISDGYRIKVA